ISGLTIGMGPIADAGDALNAFIHSIPYNIYAITAVILVGLIAAGLVPEFGPMKKAERRAMDEGKVLRDGAVPLIGRELTETPMFPDIKPRLFLNFILPVILIIIIVLGSFVLTGSAKTLEAYLAVVIFLGVSIRIQGIRLNDIMDTAMTGIKGIMPAIMILVFAYTINQLSRDMGTADYMVSISRDFLTPSMLPLATYLLAAVMAFSTGTSWGTFAIMLPIAVPVALVYSGDALTDIVYATIAAVAGGGVFGDHCSPLSDTSILASTGAASDHIDHVRTQIPYAMIAAVLTGVVYLVMGLTVWS
ncbi:MAG: transporter, partial [Gemmatimonadetes bacterium]|nr:transporter [Gemmatimonadota bacterium]